MDANITYNLIIDGMVTEVTLDTYLKYKNSSSYSREETSIDRDNNTITFVLNYPVFTLTPSK